jgi:hypothetical protein
MDDLNLDSSASQKVKFPLQESSRDNKQTLDFKIQEVQSEGSLEEDDEKLKRSLLMNSQLDGDDQNLSYFVDSRILFSNSKLSKSEVQNTHI